MEPGAALRLSGLPIIVCPRLKYLHLNSCTEPLHFARETKLAAGDSGGRPTLHTLPLQHLTLLRITGSRVSKAFLQDLLGHVGPQLTTVTIATHPWNTEREGRFLPDDITPGQLFESLLSWAETLRAVRTDLSRVTPRAVKLGKADLITSLSQFSRLEVLELDLSCVYIAHADAAQAHRSMLVDLLPESICEFVLKSPTGPVYDALEELSSRTASGRFPNLVEVGCDDGPAAHLEHLRDRFGKAGVNFSLRAPKSRFGRRAMPMISNQLISWVTLAEGVVD